MTDQVFDDAMPIPSTEQLLYMLDPFWVHGIVKVSPGALGQAQEWLRRPWIYEELRDVVNQTPGVEWEFDGLWRWIVRAPPVTVEPVVAPVLLFPRNRPRDPLMDLFER